jgi:hypothetical protein
VLPMAIVWIIKGACELQAARAAMHDTVKGRGSVTA